MILPRLRSLLRSCAPLLLAAAALLPAPLARAATTASDIAPANLPGSTFTLRYSGNRTFETNLSLTNNLFTLQFTSATTYVRSGSGTPGIITEGGTYTVTASTELAGIRTTVLTFNNNFTAPGSTTPVVITFVSSPGDPFASNFTLISGTATAGGIFTVERVAPAPAITSANTALATVGQPFTYQITASNAPTSYRAVAGVSTPIPTLAVNNSGLVSATFPAAGLYTFNAFATNAAGSTFVQVAVTVTAGATTGGGTSSASLQVFGSNQFAQNTVPAGLTDVVSLAIADSHCLAAKSDGTVVMWGTDIARANSVPAGLSGVVAVSAQGFNSMALRSNGTVVAWGDPRNNQTLVPAGLTGVIAIACGTTFSVALKSDGTVVAWGAPDAINVPAGLTGVVAIGAGYGHGVALKSNGTVVAWGVNQFGEINVPANLTGVAAIAAGCRHSLALKTDGTFVSWGYDPDRSLAIIPAGLTGVTAIACGAFHNIALKSNGTAVAWGMNTNGQTTIPSTLTGITRIAAGSNNTGLIIGGTSDGSTVTPPATTPIVAAPNIGALAGTYSGQQFAGVPGPAATTLVGDFVATVTAGGDLRAQGGTISGRVDASGNVTFDPTGSNLAFGYTTGRIDNGRLTATGQLAVGGRLLATYRIDAPRITGTASTAVSAVAAPGNLVGYRNRVGQTFEFTVTGATGGAVWGTDVYTDDSSIARAAVHAGVVAVGQSRVVTVTILPGQSSYPASTRNGVTSASWGAWSGSYSFAGAGAVIANATATARPALATGFTATAATLSAGGRLVLPVAVSGGGSYTYQWFLNGLALAGATANPYVVDSVGAAQAGTYTVDVTNALGTTRLSAGTVTITSVGAPVLALQPFAKTVSPGGTFTMAANASGSGNVFQWFRNGTALAGETGAILLRQNVTAADAGNYTVRVTNAAGTVTSTAGAVTLSPTASRPANISVRASVAAGQSIIPGFYVAGLGTKRVIVRAVGPGLNQFNVGGTMADPKLELFRGSTKIAENDNWDGAAATTNAFAGVGAFGLATGSRDAVLIANVAAGESYTAVVSGVGTSSGVVLIEVYDADAVATSTSRLTNVSVRGGAGTGDSTLILGLVIGGDGQRTLLVRGVGPQLAAFGVTGALADPRLQIFDSAQRAVLANDNWGQADFPGELLQATSYVGAFALEPGSRDAATLSLLDPGSYTIHVSGAGTSTGEALVEVYEVP